MKIKIDETIGYGSLALTVNVHYDPTTLLGLQKEQIELYDTTLLVGRKRENDAVSYVTLNTALSECILDLNIITIGTLEKSVERLHSMIRQSLEQDGLEMSEKDKYLAKYVTQLICREKGIDVAHTKLELPYDTVKHGNNLIELGLETKGLSIAKLRYIGGKK